MKKVFCLLFALLCSGTGLIAQNVNPSQFQPCLSVFMGEDIFDNQFDAAMSGSGKIPMARSRNDWSQLLTGFSVTNRFYFRNNVFLHTGISYADCTSSDFNNIVFELTWKRQPYRLSLPFEFESLTIPLWIGKEHYFNNDNCSWSLYGGISAGMLMLTGFEEGQFGSSLLYYLEQDGSEFQRSFYLSVDGGLDVHPFPRLSGFGLGLSAGVQVNKTQFPNPYTVVLKNTDATEEYPFNLDIHPRQAFNVRLICSYTFSRQKRYKNKRLRKINPFSCPK